MTPKNAVRVSSNPDITSGIRSFRITIVRPKPNALKIPIRGDVGKGASFDSEVWIILSGSAPSPNDKEADSSHNKLPRKFADFSSETAFSKRAIQGTLSRFFEKVGVADKSGNLPECYCGTSLISHSHGEDEDGLSKKLLNSLYNEIKKVQHRSVSYGAL